MNEFQICERCNEPSKRPVGVWDDFSNELGKTSGWIYACDSQRCKIAVHRREMALKDKEKKEQATAKNDAEGIDPKHFRALRMSAGMTMMDAAEAVGIRPSELSAYENCRLPFPKLIYEELTAVFQERRGRGQ